MAPTYQMLLDALAPDERTALLGLSATPGRGLDPNETRRLAEFFAFQKVTLRVPGYTP